MIEIAKLTSMLEAEIEMAKAWDSMSPRERKAYTIAHPNSRYNSGKEKGTKSNLHGHFEKHGWTKSGTNTYKHKNGRKIVIKKPTKAGKNYHIEVHHSNGDITSHHRSSANNVGALIRHWGKADKKGHYKPRAYKVGTHRGKAAPVVAPKKRGRPPKAGNPQPIKSFKDLVARHPELKGPSAAKRGRPRKVAAEPVAAPKKLVKRVDKIKAAAPMIEKVAKKKLATKIAVKKPLLKKPLAKKIAPKLEAPIKKPLVKKPLVKKIAPKAEAPIAKKPLLKKPVLKKATREADWGEEAPVAKKPVAKKVAPKVAKPVAEKPVKKPALKKASRSADW